MSFLHATSKDLISQYESDMENGNFKEWIETFPSHLNEIFVDYMSMCEDIQESDIDYFVKVAVDINVRGTFSSETETALQLMAERRNFKLLQHLIDNGAKEDDEEQLLLNIIMGHSSRDDPSESNSNDIINSLKVVLKNFGKGNYESFCRKMEVEYMSNKYIGKIIEEMGKMSQN